MNKLKIKSSIFWIGGALSVILLIAIVLTSIFTITKKNEVKLDTVTNINKKDNVYEMLNGKLDNNLYEKTSLMINDKLSIINQFTNYKDDHSANEIHFTESSIKEGILKYCLNLIKENGYDTTHIAIEIKYLIINNLDLKLDIRWTNKSKNVPLEDLDWYYCLLDINLN